MFEQRTRGIILHIQCCIVNQTVKSCYHDNIVCVVSIRYTYEVAPVFTLIEDAVLRKMMEMIGWEEGGDGIFNAGTVTGTY